MPPQYCSHLRKQKTGHSSRSGDRFSFLTAHTKWHTFIIHAHPSKCSTPSDTSTVSIKYMHMWKPFQIQTTLWSIIFEELSFSFSKYTVHLIILVYKHITQKLWVIYKPGTIKWQVNNRCFLKDIIMQQFLLGSYLHYISWVLTMYNEPSWVL